jgi:hypothetical protein
MIGRHNQVAMLNEEFGFTLDKVVSKPIVGNKLCIPNQIELDDKKPAWARLFGSTIHEGLYRLGYFTYRPEALFSINEFLEQKENAKLIGILRDGNAVLSSIQRRGEQTFEVASYRWRRSIEILHVLHRRLGSDMLLLTFEQLVQAPEAAMRSVSDFLSVPYQSRMLEGYAYTPIYSNSGIDPERASRNRKDKSDYDLPALFPDTLALYDELLRVTSPTPAAPASSPVPSRD